MISFLFLFGSGDEIIGGNAVETAKFKVSFRRAKKTVIDDLAMVPTAFLKYAEPTADKTAIKDAIARGEVVPGAHIEESLSMNIK